MFIDSHAHLDFINNLEDVLKRAKLEGIGKIITIGTSVEASRECIEIASTSSSQTRLRGASENIPQIYATVGIHPKDGKADIEKFGTSRCIETLRQIAKSSKEVVGIGEAGLDYRLVTDDKQLTTDKDKKFQRELFERQIELAAKLKLPLVIHCRNAWDDIFSLLTTGYRLRTKLGGVFHCWTGNWQAAKKALDLGFYISFSGIVTYKNAGEVAEVAQKAPLERILLETDSPFLVPEPLRSGPPKLTSRLSSTVRTRLEERNRRGYKQNEPKNVKITAQFLASLRNEPLEEIAKVTSENAKRLFKLES